MHGITLTYAPADWEIIQHTCGKASVRLAGRYNVHPAAIKVGVAEARPLARVMNENDNSTVVPWTPLRHEQGPDFTGSFDDCIEIPCGGPYRIDTTLETRSTLPGITWLYRGDCRLHIGVGSLFIIAGQSNASGTGRDYALDPPDMRVHLFRNRSTWDIACHPMNESTFAGSLPNEEMGIPGVSPYLSFAKCFSGYSGCPVGLVQTALGGSRMEQWHPETGELFRNMIDKIKLTGGRYSGVLWYQGCSDCTPGADDSYLENFSRMVNALRRHLGYDIPFFTCQLNRFVGCTDDESWGKVRDAQRLACRTLENVYVMTTVNNPMSDGIHNSAHGNIALGERLARQAAGILLDGYPAFEAPDYERCEYDGTALKLYFSNMSLGFMIPSLTPANCGFMLEDDEGRADIKEVKYAREDRNCITLIPSRDLHGRVLLSFAWEADPTRFPPLDEVTYLPPVSLYRQPLDL